MTIWPDEDEQNSIYVCVHLYADIEHHLHRFIVDIQLHWPFGVHHLHSFDHHSSPVCVNVGPFDLCLPVLVFSFSFLDLACLLRG